MAKVERLKAARSFGRSIGAVVANGSNPALSPCEERAGRAGERGRLFAAPPLPVPMTRSRPLARPSTGLRLRRIPFVASQATQVLRLRSEARETILQPLSLRKLSSRNRQTSGVLRHSRRIAYGFSESCAVGSLNPRLESQRSTARASACRPIFRMFGGRSCTGRGLAESAK